MCGIVGVKGLVDEGLLKKMKAALRHRGPDQDGAYVDKNVMLGHQRLSILDLSEKGRQPMRNEDGSVWVTFNGEIYNYTALRAELEKSGHRFASNSDTEVLVHGYEQWGEALPEKLDGDFAFALWDASNKKLFLARDPVGVVPLYYAQVDRAFWFASEVKAFFEYEKMQRKLSQEAFNDYLCFRYPVGPRTLFEGIYKVQPGEALTVTDVVKKRKYFGVSYSEKQWTENAAIETLCRLFRESVKKRLQSDVPLGAYLSGGLDSSFVVATASEFGPVHTFSVEFGEDDETEYVKEIVSRFDTKHTWLRVDARRFDLLGEICWHMDEPPADIAALPTYLMAEQTKKHATVVLTGDGGDETFGGYTRYSTLLKLKKWRKLLTLLQPAANLFLQEPIAKRLKEALSARDDKELFLAYVAAFSEEEKKQWLQQIKKLEVAFPSSSSFLNEMMEWDLKTLLPDDYLMKVNKASMAHAVETRVPFLDKALVEFAATLPPYMKATESQTRIIHRKALRGIVPEKIINRPKHGFNVPTRKWLSEGLKEVAAQFFELLAKREYFRREKLDSFLKQYGKNEAYDSRQFWTLFGFEIWCQTFLDQEKPKPIKI